MEETERDCLLFAFYATVGEVIEKTSGDASLVDPHLGSLTENVDSILRHACSVEALSLGHLFRPIAIEVFGRWGEGAEETLKEVSLLAPSVLGVPYGQFKRDWAIQLAVCLQKENAEMINNKILSIVGRKTIEQKTVAKGTVDYWPFIEGLQNLQPCLQEIINKFSRKPFESNNDRCLAWIRYSLQERALQSHLAILVASQDHLKRNYHSHAFLRSRHHMSALRDCLKSLDQKSIDLLPDLVDFTNIGMSQFSPGSLPSPTDHPVIGSYNDYDSGVECIPSETGDLSKVVHVSNTNPRTLEFGRMHEPLAVVPTTAVASFRRIKGGSFNGLSTKDRDTQRHRGLSGAQQLLQKLQHEERKSRSLTSTPELPTDVFLRVKDQTGIEDETRDLSSHGEGRNSPCSDISAHSEEDFVLIAAPFADTNRMVENNEEIECVDETENGILLIDQEIINGDIVVDLATSQEDMGVVTSTGKPEKKRRLKSPLANENHVSLLETMGSPRLFAADNLEKDNAHFSVADVFIAAIEEVNATRSEKRHFFVSVDEVRQYVRLRTRKQSAPFISHSEEHKRREKQTESDEEEFELSGSWNGKDGDSSETSDIKDHMSSSMASLFATSDFVANHRLPKHMSSPRNCPDNSSPTAAAVGDSLLELFSPEVLPAQSRLRRMLTNKSNETDLPSPITSNAEASTSTEETSAWTDPSRVRGNHEWAPPRAQIIFNIHPLLKRRVIIEKQNYRCAGCGLKINRQHIKFFRYCEYMGRYFCSSCHHNNIHVIPGRILHKWDFKAYPVSNFAYELLSGILYDPVFNVAGISRQMVHKVKELNMAASLRRQLYHLKDFIRVCRLADSLSPDFEQCGYLVFDSEWTLFSLHHLILLHQGELIRLLKDLLSRGLKHVDGCQLCQARGFVCEVCRNGKDIIFPFQINKCIQCRRCRNCFHRLCFERVQNRCLRCERLKARKDSELAIQQTLPS